LIGCRHSEQSLSAFWKRARGGGFLNVGYLRRWQINHTDIVLILTTEMPLGRQALEMKQNCPFCSGPAPWWGHAPGPRAGPELAKGPSMPSRRACGAASHLVRKGTPKTVESAAGVAAFRTVLHPYRSSAGRGGSRLLCDARPVFEPIACLVTCLVGVLQHVPAPAGAAGLEA
jgi:hypothetical protein